MADEIGKLILELVSEHDGEWGWYQIDRALSLRGVVSLSVPETMRKLVKNGLVVVEGDPQHASTRYFVTLAGRSMLRK